LHQTLGIAAEDSTSKKGYSFSNASFTGRTTWSTISVVYQEIFPSFLAPSVRTFCRSARFIKAISSTLAASAIRQAPANARTPRRAMKTGTFAGLDIVIKFTTDFKAALC